MCEILLILIMVESHKFWLSFTNCPKYVLLAGTAIKSGKNIARLMNFMIAVVNFSGQIQVSTVLVVAGGDGVDSDLQEAAGEGAEARGSRAIGIISSWRVLWVHCRAGTPDLLPQIETSLADIAEESEEGAEPLDVVEDLNYDEEGAEGPEGEVEVVKCLCHREEGSENDCADQVGSGAAGGHFATASSVPILIPGQHPVPQHPGPARVHPSQRPDRGQAEDHFIPRRQLSRER